VQLLFVIQDVCYIFSCGQEQTRAWAEEGFKRSAPGWKRERIVLFGFAVTHWKAPNRPKESKEILALGAYTTRNAPAPENRDEIVAGPIEAAHYFAQYFAQYYRYATRATRAI
jgi:hypothetical protein